MGLLQVTGIRNTMDDLEAMALSFKLFEVYKAFPSNKMKAKKQLL
jgi:hypothetical protein